MDIRTALESLASDEEREALRKARLSSLNRDLAPFKLGKQAGHGVSAKGVAKRRSRNAMAKRTRKSQRGRRG